jgi:prepilin-type N-terminal cleavage/methylation domain-containing protein
MHIFVKHNNMRGGLTLVEIVIALSIFLMISATVYAPLAKFREQKTLDAAVEETLAAFSRAHLDTISSLNDMQYGVHLDSDKIVYFVGTTYDSMAVTNVAYELSSVVEIANVMLADAGTDVVFERLNGGTTQSGTFEIRSKNDTTLTTLVTISGTGAVSL